jgi:hypothetical protein
VVLSANHLQLFNSLLDSLKEEIIISLNAML